MPRPIIIPYVVIVPHPDGLSSEAFGPYRDFREAEADAQAWSADAYVLPLQSKGSRGASK